MRRVGAVTALVLVVGAFLCAVAFTIVAAIDGNPVRRGGCRRPPTQAGDVGAHLGPGQASLKLREGQSALVQFGRSRIAKGVLLFLDVRGALPHPDVPLHTIKDDFRRADDGRLDLRYVVPRAVVDGNVVRLTVCFGRVHNHLGDPGTYTGSVTIDDARLAAPVTVPLTVTMQYVHGFILLWMFVPVIVPGAWVLWVINTRRDPRTSAFDVRGLLSWTTSVGGLVAIVTATVASVAVYIGTFLRDPTWGASVLEPLSLYGAMFSAFVTTGGITQLARLTRGDPDPHASEDSAAGGTRG